MYTDGGCTDPQYRSLRRATYGVCYADQHAENKASALTGVEQTAGRAELRAALEAFELADEATEVVSDNDWVVKGTYRIIMGQGRPEGAHQDLWIRMEAAISKLGRGAAGIRWTKGHATQEHIDQGYSNQADQYGNDKADKLATLAQEDWKVNVATKEYFYTRRTAAKVMQRMMVACALARKKAIIHMRDSDIAARLGEGTREEGGEADMEEEGVGQEVGMRSMVNEANTLRTAFLGAAWDAGTRIGRYNLKYNVYPIMSKKDWGGGKAPYSMAEPVL